MVKELTQVVIDPGSPAPVFKLPDQDGGTHSLGDYKGKWLVMYFYPKDSTPGCTKESCQFRDDHAEFTGRGAVVIGVSPDGQASHTRFAEKHALGFPLLADTEKAVCTAYGVWRQKSMFGRKYMGVVRTTYLIDPKGRVAHRWDKVKVSGHEKAVLRRLDELLNEA